MIHVDRSSIAPPDLLTQEKKSGKKETQRAVTFYQKQLARALFNKEFDQLTEPEKDQVVNFTVFANPSPSLQLLTGSNYEFKVYSSNDIKGALRDLFHGKCAYCESAYAGTQPMDVEHWRPKGGFVDENDPEREKLIWPGYFWLASDWTNLLPSCIDCNRRRNQVVWSQKNPLRMGKESQFPVANESKRWRYPGQTVGEEPLLLNPCAENPQEWPENHLTFDLKEATLLPLPDPVDSSRSSPKAVASIRVYALNRTDLVLARQERLRLMEYHKYTIIKLSALRELLEARPGDHEDELAIVEDLLAYEFAALDRFKDPDQPFSLLAQKFIEAFENELRR